MHKFKVTKTNDPNHEKIRNKHDIVDRFDYIDDAY